MKTIISLILITLLSTAFVLRAQDTPIISEFMTSNLEALEDEDEDPSDWIEFYNPGDSSYSLAGHFLTAGIHVLSAIPSVKTSYPWFVTRIVCSH